MPITSKLEDLKDEYDIIIAGGGSAGCVLAGKLSEATRAKGISILVVESGRNNHNDPNVIRPGRYWSNLAPGSGYFDSVKAKLEYCGGREVAVAVPNILGGGGSLNFMMYTRASASDYDDWKTEGWSAKDLIPILRKLENYQNQADTKPDKSLHGFSGPFAISQGPGWEHENEIATEVHDAARSLGFPVHSDMQDLKKGHGFSEWAKWIDPVTGNRQDPAHRYIHPNTSDPNTGLTVLCEHKVVRVVINNGKVDGVEVVPTITAKLNLPSPTEGVQSATIKDAEVEPPKPSSEPTPRTIRARIMVVVTAGTVNTAAILERSGIGSQEVLQKASVDCIVDLPGVGENFQDHTGCPSIYRFDKLAIPHHNDYLNGDPKAIEQADNDLKQNKGAHTTNFVASAAKVRPTAEELEEMGPEFRKLWNEYYKDAPDKCLFITAFLERNIDPVEFPFLSSDFAYLAFIPYTMYPISRGSVHITGPQITSLPDFRPQYLSSQLDILPHVLGYKQQREISRRMQSFRGEIRELHPKFSEDSPARCVEYPTPEQRAEMAKKKIVYSPEDNKVIEDWVKATFLAVWHWLGTCAMKPREKGGVVDAKLSVYGVKGLKVADISICPENVGANTYSTALLVGAKAAEIIADELGLEVPNTNSWVE